jgi:hypothetical protein
MVVEQQQPKIVNVKAKDLLVALDRAIKPMHLVYKKKNGEIVNSYGTRNVEYLKGLNLRNANGPVDLNKIGVTLRTKVESPAGVYYKPRYPYYDTVVPKWRSFTVGEIVGMTPEEVQAAVSVPLAPPPVVAPVVDTTPVASLEYILKDTDEAKNLLKDKISFIKLLALADEVSRKTGKKQEELTIDDVIKSNVSRDKVEARKIVSAPRLHTRGSLVVKGRALE